MVDLHTLAGSLGAGLVKVIVPGSGREVTDVTVVEPGEGWYGVPGDLVFGVGVPDPAAAVALIERLGEVGSAGVVLRQQLTRTRPVRAAARAADLALVEIAPTAALAHVLGLVRSVLDRATVVGADLPDAAAPDDLFTLADAVAAVVDAPVTIEDASSRVLAYSSRQDVTDPARIDTIVGRRVPPQLVAHFRALGLFRRLARSDEPFLVPPGPTQDLPRLVVPVRAGGEWLGSIWVVTERLPEDRVLRELRQVATVLAIRLLRVRAESDLTRRVTADRLRVLLRGAGGGHDWLPSPPWRVVVLSRPSDSSDVSGDLDVWETIFRRHRWQRPLLTDEEGVAVALVVANLGSGGDASAARRPGSWSWLAGVVAVERAADPTLQVWGSAPVGGGEVGVGPGAVGGLVRALAEAVELASLRGVAEGEPAVAFETRWREVALARAAKALRPADGPPSQPLPGGLEDLRRHDEVHGTAYLLTLTAHLDHQGDPARAAAAVHVHPNTLRYRLARIAEVADLGLDDPQTRLALRLHLLGLAVT